MILLKYSQQASRSHKQHSCVQHNTIHDKCERKLVCRRKETNSEVEHGVTICWMIVTNQVTCVNVNPKIAILQQDHSSSSLKARWPQPSPHSHPTPTPHPTHTHPPRESKEITYLFINDALYILCRGFSKAKSFRQRLGFFQVKLRGEHYQNSYTSTVSTRILLKHRHTYWLMCIHYLGS